MLKPKQRAVCEYMVLNPDLTNEQYAEYIGINPKTLYAWKKDEEFNKYIHELCKKKFASMERLALQKLKENVNKGNQKAIEYILNGTGYQLPQQVEVTEKTINIHIGE